MAQNYKKQILKTVLEWKGDKVKMIFFNQYYLNVFFSFTPLFTFDNEI